MTTQKIIALVDGSVYSQSVCDHAAWIAAKINASVTLLHVLGRRETGNEPSNLSGNIGLGARTALLEELSDLDAQRAKLVQKRGRAILEDAQIRIQKANAIEVTTLLRNGEIVDTLQEFENDAELIVIGKRGEAADFDKLHLGSNLERVVRSSHKPVLVASRAYSDIERILIAFDGGSSVMKAIDFLSSTKIFKHLHCTLLYVGEETVDRNRQLEGASAMLSDVGHTTTVQYLSGQPEAVIAEQIDAQKINLLVMGAYGHSRIRNLIIGSTTTEMIRSCKVPVMLFR